MRILTGIEVDILEDGSLDQEPELLDRLDVVVASVHSKLAMDSAAMTRRMVNAVTNPHTDVLGHCTGRLVTGGRGVTARVEVRRREGLHRVPRQRHRRGDQLAAGTARPADPAAEAGDGDRMRVLDRHRFARARASWNSSATAPSARWTTGCAADRIVNTWPADKLLEWTTS